MAPSLVDGVRTCVLLALPKEVAKGLCNKSNIPCVSGTALTTKSSSTLSTAVRGVTKNLFDDRQQVVCDRRETVVGRSARCPRQIHASLPFRQARKVLCQTVQLLTNPPRLQAFAFMTSPCFHRPRKNMGRKSEEH